MEKQAEKTLERGRTPFERGFFGLFSKTTQDSKLKFNREVYLNLPKLFLYNSDYPQRTIVPRKWKKPSKKRAKGVGPLLSEGFLAFSPL